MMRRFINSTAVLLSLFLVSCICAVNPKELHFDASETTKTFTLWIPGGVQEPTGWSIDANVDWVIVEPIMGHNYGDNTIYVTVDRTGLEPGDYSGRLCINTEHALCACQVDITMEVTGESPEPYPDTGHVEGHVYDAVTDEGIAGAMVWIDSIGEVITEQPGHYELSNVPPGFHTIHAVMDGYSDYFGEISVMSNLTTTHNIFMLPIEQSTSTTTSVLSPESTTTTIQEPVVIVACCQEDGSCLEVPEDLCENPVYFYLSCSEVNCQPEACCLPDGSCDDTLIPYNCNHLNGVCQGSGSTCATTNCPQTQGCCLSGGYCEDWIPDSCLNYGGMPIGEGSNCATYTCPRACCYPDGTCDESAPDSCDTIENGISQELGTTCATANCPQPEACCFSDGSCNDYAADHCSTIFNGSPQGPGTTCATVICIPF